MCQTGLSAPTNNGDVAVITNNLNTQRTQSFTYDELNRIKTASTQATTGTYAWGLSFGYDVWGNLLSATVTQGSAPMLSVSVNTNNRITNTGFSHDTAGNMMADGVNSYLYDAESRLKTAAGVTYTYDGDGKRVQKTTGKLYWYGMSADPLVETDAAGNNPTEFIFFNGKRIARRDSTGTVSYYFADHLGTARAVTDATGTILDDSDFYPFGGERPVVGPASGNTYRFTGKERDSESGLDNFIARYDSSNLGRFMSPDPSNYGAIDESPQTWNMYSYVANNPLNATDPNGLDCVYTQNFSKDGTVTVERGNCTQRGGNYAIGVTLASQSWSQGPFSLSQVPSSFWSFQFFLGGPTYQQQLCRLSAPQALIAAFLLACSTTAGRNWSGLGALSCLPRRTRT